MIAYFDSGPIMSAFQTMNAKQEGLHATVRKLYETEVERIIHLSELRPFVIQGFCLRAVNRILQDGRTKVTVADIEAIKESVLAEVASMISAGLSFLD
ncbi:hypothetical protein HYR99_07730 [Candidatus Poribacteria bacterium]|nr:hypothetical protein [Candidatus Poribacteria bacterium]